MKLRYGCLGMLALFAAAISIDRYSVYRKHAEAIRLCRTTPRVEIFDRIAWGAFIRRMDPHRSAQSIAEVDEINAALRRKAKRAGAVVLYQRVEQDAIIGRHPIITYRTLYIKGQKTARLNEVSVDNGSPILPYIGEFSTPVCIQSLKQAPYNAEALAFLIPPIRDGRHD